MKKEKQFKIGDKVYYIIGSQAHPGTIVGTRVTNRKPRYVVEYTPRPLMQITLINTKQYGVVDIDNLAEREKNE